MHALHATFFSDDCRHTVATPSSGCFPRMLWSDRSRKLAFYAQGPRPDIANVRGRRHSLHKTLTTDVARSKHLRSQQLTTQGKGTKNKICLHCQRPTKTSSTDGKTKTPRCASPAHQQKGVFASTNRKRWTSKRVPREAVSTQRCARVCQFMFAVALQVQ